MKSGNKLQMKENLDIIEVFCCFRGGVTMKLTILLKNFVTDHLAHSVLKSVDNP